MNNQQDIALAAAQRFDPSGKYQQRSKWIVLVLEYLGEDELPEAGIFALRGRAIGFLWLTNKRLLYAGRDEGSLFKGPVFISHSYDKISSIQVVSKRAALSMITIRIGDDAIEFGITPTTVGSEEFVALVRKKISIATDVATGSSVIDLPTQLERLSQLKRQGMLTEEEYRVAKAKLLGL